MPILILPTAESHFDGLRNVLEDVAREKRFLAFTQAPPREQAFAFFQNIVDHDLCQFLALQNNLVIGWCDILPTHGEARAHVATLGVGIIAHARHLGIGTKLMHATLSKAWLKGYTRIELTVRTDNLNGIALYKRMGFVQEGLNKNAFFT